MYQSQGKAMVTQFKREILEALVWLQLIKLLCSARKYDVLHIHACSYWGMVPAVMGVMAGKLWNKLFEVELVKR